MSLILDNLYIASIEELENVELIRDVSLHINAAEEIDELPYTHFKTQIDLNWTDYPLQDINENNLLIHLIKLIDSYRINNKKVIVNCYMGVSRSSIIVIAYVMYHLKMSVMDSINFVRQKRPIINPNYGFVCQLYNLENIILNLDNINYIVQNKSEEEFKKEINETYEKVPFIKEKFPKENFYKF
jgi:protein-tyrosine phosphatase